MQSYYFDKFVLWHLQIMLMNKLYTLIFIELYLTIANSITGPYEEIKLY